jgi:hypothetical protein
VARLVNEDQEPVYEYIANPNADMNTWIAGLLACFLMVIAFFICVVIYNQHKQNKQISEVIRLSGMDIA